MGSQAEEGWPLGLPPVTFRMRLVDAFTAAAGGGGEGGGDGGGDANSLVSTSFSSSNSSDLDTQSTMSFFPEKRISLGSLIGIAGAAADPSFRHSLSSAAVTSKIPSGRHNWLTRRTDSGAKLWNLIRCGSCRGACYAADDANSCMIGEPPSLGHFLEAEREAERSGNDAKVYINIMYEEAAGAYMPRAINPLFDSDTSPGVNINASSSAAVELPSLAEEDTEPPISSPFGRSRNTSVAAHSMQSMHIDGVFRAAVASPMRQKKHGRSYSDGVCVLNCVSCMSDFPKGSDIKENGSHDTYTCSRIKERKCGPKKGICHTNYSPDGTHSMRFDGEAQIRSSNSGLNVTDFARIDVLKAEICSRKGINFGQLSGCYGQKEAK